LNSEIASTEGNSSGTGPLSRTLSVVIPSIEADAV
jgi:hypothetical protein